MSEGSQNERQESNCDDREHRRDEYMTKNRKRREEAHSHWPSVDEPSEFRSHFHSHNVNSVDSSQNGFALRSSRTNSENHGTRNIFRTPKNNNGMGTNDESAFLFSHSFDSMSEGSDYFRNDKENYQKEFASPNNALHERSGGSQNFDSPLEGLSHDDFDCSLEDISPIKIVEETVEHPGDRNCESRDAVNYGERALHRTRLDFFAEAGGPWDDLQSRNRNNKPPPQVQVSNPYFVIRSCEKAFASCTYRLPCLNEKDNYTARSNQYGENKHGGEEDMTVSSNDLIIATRRVESAICFFGGDVKSSGSLQTTSIFRSSPTRSKKRYEQGLQHRYHIREGHFSWEVEEDPPIVLHDEKDAPRISPPTGSQDSTRNLHVVVDENGYENNYEHSRAHPSSPTPSFAPDLEAKKMKYRCKLCGQLKQNHNCPYRQSLQRSIGIMVYPAVNAFTANEPGILTTTLSKMNNFVTYGSAESRDDGYSRSDSNRQNHSSCRPSTVTPQSLREGGMISSPQSSLSTHSLDVSPPIDSRSSNSDVHNGITNVNRKRTHSQVSNGSGTNSNATFPFVASVALRPEHYRAVTRQQHESSTAYQYPPVPLTFTDRKRLSDTLFVLSKEIPSITRGCASILQRARARGEWDRAVAELMTQVVVGLYCGEGDGRLDGLHQYLLALGVAC